MSYKAKAPETSQTRTGSLPSQKKHQTFQKKKLPATRGNGKIELLSNKVFLEGEKKRAKNARPLRDRGG